MTREEVLAVIEEGSEYNVALHKAGILNQLGLDDTKENRKILDPILAGLKEDGSIATYQLFDEEDGKFCGRGYAIKED